MIARVGVRCLDRGTINTNLEMEIVKTRTYLAASQLYLVIIRN